MAAELTWLDKFFGRIAVFFDGAPLPERPTIEFAGTGVEVEDDAVNARTLVTFTAAEGELTAPGGLDTHVQFNDAGDFAGTAKIRVVSGDPELTDAVLKGVPVLNVTRTQITGGVRVPIEGLVVEAVTSNATPVAVTLLELDAGDLVTLHAVVTAQSSTGGYKTAITFSALAFRGTAGDDDGAEILGTPEPVIRPVDSPLSVSLVPGSGGDVNKIKLLFHGLESNTIQFGAEVRLQTQKRPA